MCPLHRCISTNHTSLYLLEAESHCHDDRGGGNNNNDDEEESNAMEEYWQYIYMAVRCIKCDYTTCTVDPNKYTPLKCAIYNIIILKTLNIIII